MITQLTQNSIGVQVPEDTMEYSVVPMTSAGTHTGTGLRIRIKTSRTISYKSLPEGKWEILGLAKNLKEDEWQKALPVQRDPDWDYPLWCATDKAAHELKSKGLQGENTLILIKQ